MILNINKLAGNAILDKDPSDSGQSRIVLKQPNILLILLKKANK